MKNTLYLITILAMSLLSCLDLSAQVDLGLAQSKKAADEYVKFNFEAARNHFLEAASFYERDSLVDNQISSLLVAADCEFRMSHFSEAEKILDTCSALSEKTDNIKTIADILKYKKELAEKKCDYALVEKIMSELFNLYDSTSDLKVKLDGFYVMANDAVRSHNYEFAKTCADKYVELTKLMPKDKQFGYYYMSCVLNHSVYRSCGDYDIALTWAKKRYELLVKYSSDIFDIALALFDMMWCYAELKDIDNLNQCLAKIEEYIESDMMSDNNRRICCTYLGMIFKRAGELQTALTYLHKAELYASGDKTQEYEVGLLIAGVLYQMGRNEDSLDYYSRMVDICASLYGNPSKEYVEVLSYLANIEAFCGKIDDGSKHFIQAVQMNREIIRSQWKYASKQSREQLWQELSLMNFQMAAYGIAAGHYCDEFTAASYDALLLSKGLMLATDKSMAQTIKTESDTNIMNLYSRILEIEKNLSEAAPDSRAELYTSLRAAEASLAEKCSAFVDYTSFMDVTYSDIRGSLSENEAVVDFTDFVSDAGIHKYLAFVIRKGVPYPELLRVFTQDQLDSLQVPLSRPDLLYASDNARTAYKIIWEPMEKKLEGCSTVFFVPSGNLHRIAVEALVRPDGERLGDKVDIVRLTSAREAVDYVSKMEKLRDAVLYGGVDYSESQYDDLPISGREVDIIGKLLQNRGADVKVYSGKTASISSFTSLDSNSPNVLHFATHGFSYDSIGDGEDQILASSKSMMRNGIVLADGKLAAGEIAGMDLSGTDIVILALCKSGNGEIAKEGIYGLQRAFKKAGAGKILMTLWNVDDSASQDFMTHFYRSLLKDGDVRSAFCGARSNVRKKYRSPYYWAGFVLLD